MRNDPALIAGDLHRCDLRQLHPAEHALAAANTNEVGAIPPGNFGALTASVANGFRLVMTRVPRPRTHA